MKGGEWACQRERVVCRLLFWPSLLLLASAMLLRHPGDPGAWRKCRGVFLKLMGQDRLSAGLRRGCTSHPGSRWLLNPPSRCMSSIWRKALRTE